MRFLNRELYSEIMQRALGQKNLVESPFFLVKIKTYAILYRMKICSLGKCAYLAVKYIAREEFV